MPSNLFREAFSQVVNLIERYDNKFILLFSQLKTLDRGINLLPFPLLVDMSIMISECVFINNPFSSMRNRGRNFSGTCIQNCKKTSWNF